MKMFQMEMKWKKLKKYWYAQHKKIRKQMVMEELEAWDKNNRKERNSMMTETRKS